MDKKKHFAVDLDGTLAEYHGWKGINHIGDPIPTMLDRVYQWLDEGHNVSIFTARADDPDAVYHIQQWLIKLNLGHLNITNVKHKYFTEFWDDRAVGIMRNTGRLASVIEAEMDKFGCDPDYFDHPGEIKNDTGSHYRYSYKGIKLDPARICKVYEVGNVLQGAIVKKTLCAGNRGHKDLIQDIENIITAAERWKQMELEDNE